MKKNYVWNILELPNSQSFCTNKSRFHAWVDFIKPNHIKCCEFVSLITISSPVGRNALVQCQDKWLTCQLTVVCYMLCVTYCVLHVVCYMCVTCCVLHAVCYMCVTYCVLHVCYMLCVTCCVLHAVCYMLCVTCCVLHVVCYMPCVTCVLHAVCYMLCVTCCLYSCEQDLHRPFDVDRQMLLWRNMIPADPSLLLQR